MEKIDVKSIRVLSSKKGMAAIQLNKKPGILTVVGIGAALVAGGWLAFTGIKAGSNYISEKWGDSLPDSVASSLEDSQVTGDATAEQQQIIVADTRQGVAATVYTKFQDAEADAVTTVYTDTSWLFDSSGSKLVDGVGANSTATVKGEVLQLFVGGANYYGEAYPAFKVESEAPTKTFQVHDIAAETSMVVTAYNSDMDALTADDATNNTADYSYSVGDNAEKVLWVKLENQDSESMYQVGAFCTFSSMNTSGVDDFEVIDSAWEEVDVPKQLDNAALSIANDANTAFTQTGYDACYKPKAGPIKMSEYDELKIKTKVTAGSTNPAANGGNNIGGLFIDAAYEDGEDGKIYLDFYKHDDNEQVTAVGLSDTTTSPQGLTTGVVIELQ